MDPWFVRHLFYHQRYTQYSYILQPSCGHDTTLNGICVKAFLHLFQCFSWKLPPSFIPMFQLKVAAFIYTNVSAESCLPDDESWKFYENRCYYFSTDELTWWNAQAYCNQNGGHLVSIHDGDTNNFIKGQVSFFYYDIA